MADLEEAGLVRTSGATTAAYRYLDERALRLLQRPSGKRSEATGWRELRARSGGHQRAMVAAQRRERQTQEALAAALEELQGRRAEEVAGQGMEWLRREALHAVRCFDSECDQCMDLERVLEEGTAVDVGDAARDALEGAADLREAATELVAAAKDRGIGARARQAEAFAQLERCL